jgi:predicted CXXCH cytochrome family protein
MARKRTPRAAAAPRKARDLQTKLAADTSRWTRRRTALVIAGLALAIGGLLFALYGRSGSPVVILPWSSKGSTPSATYVGVQACAGCHAEEYHAWKRSDHALAMQHADAQSILGNFDNARFAYAGTTSTFFKRDGRFFVNTDGRDGKLQDFEIKYTFGLTPLQQYLIEFPDGRLQVLSIAWDARPKKEGGQRWLHLYPNDKITHDDELHWTRPAQNWNFMCADCHSTDLRKNYDAATDKFQTRWAEINVGCEACHGPASNHLAWANSQSPSLQKGGKGGLKSTEEIPLNPPLSKGEKFYRTDSTKGLSARLDERRGVTWIQNATSGNAVRSKPRATEREIEVCAQCHARRGQIAEGYAPGKPFLDYYRPALLTSPLYHADGQQRDEVYNWGSFLQSKMYANGVTCSDCHNPHSGKLRAEGNVLCASCHQPSKYDTAAHHHHKPASAGAACVTCHMPTTTYMVVDPRHDHSLRVPRPDLSVQLGTPNACNGCHANRDARWAATQVKQWYGHDPQGYQRFAPAFFAVNAHAVDATSQLRALAADARHPAIARATALVQFTTPLSQVALDTIVAALRDPSPLVRLAALQSLANAPPDARLRLAAPLLSDPLKAIRIEAASVLAPVPAEQLSAQQRAAFERASGEYVASQRYNADRAEARVNLGTFYATRGDVAKGEAEIKAAIALDRASIPAYVNLADLYRAQGRDADGERILREGSKVSPKSAMLHHALGLALVRLKRTDAALTELESATVLEPGSARFAYVYAVALHSTGKSDAAIAKLKKALSDHPNDRDILEALASFHSARGDSSEARMYADRARSLTNE